MDNMQETKQKITKIQVIFIILTLLCMGLIFYYSSMEAEESTKQSSRVSMILGKMIYKDFGTWSLEDQLEFSERTSTLVRKTAHGLEYGMLSCLVLGSLGGIEVYKRQYQPKSLESKHLKSILIFKALIITALYAASDEFHQLFVKGRSGKVGDVFIDTFGAIICLAIAHFLLTGIYKRKRRR